MKMKNSWKYFHDLIYDKKIKIFFEKKKHFSLFISTQPRINIVLMSKWLKMCREQISLITDKDENSAKLFIHIMWSS